MTPSLLGSMRQMLLLLTSLEPKLPFHHIIQSLVVRASISAVDQICNRTIIRDPAQHGDERTAKNAL